MANTTITTLFFLLLLLLLLSSFTLSMKTYNILDFGAKPDGLTDSSGPLLAAWAKACSSMKPALIIIPSGTFFVSQALFQGPCNNTNIGISIQGTLVAPFGYTSSDRWFGFKYVSGVSVSGGIFDGRGQRMWNCKLGGGSNCPMGATSIAVSESKNVFFSGITLVNSELFHILIFGSSGVTMRNVKITSPENSPNTDGMHLESSDHVSILGSVISTGDDCISLGQGSTDVLIEQISCGPGHGISIGSLGETADEAGVQNITVKTVTFTGTQNGFRIKTWADPNAGFVKDVNFQNAVMKNVQNPILIDQNYCPSNVNCPNQNSGIKISNVIYSNIQGTSATQVAVNFDCSASNSCSGIRLQDINLSYGKIQAQSSCRNAIGSTSGTVVPASCLGL